MTILTLQHPDATEGEIHRAFVKWLNLMERQDSRFKYFMHVSNEGRRNPKMAGLLKAHGVKKGVPDFLCLCPIPPFSGLAIELKKKGGKVSDEQKEWLTRLSEARWWTLIAYDLDGAIDCTKAYFGLDK